MQGFRARSRSAKSERECAEALLIEAVFQGNKHECLTHAKRLAEASKVFLLSCNFESPAHASALVDELDESEKPAVHTPSLHTVSRADILALVFELEPEKSTRCVAVFQARKDNKTAKRCAQVWKVFLLSCNFESPAHVSAFLGRELGATPLVDELGESEKSAVHTPSLHTVSCTDILASVYELEPEKSSRCVAVFLARTDNKPVAQVWKVFLFSCNFESPAHASATVSWVDILALVQELEPEKSIRCVAVFLALADNKPAKLFAQVWKVFLFSCNFESPAQASATVSCADILALVQELEPEKSIRCVAVFLALADNKPAKRLAQVWKVFLFSSNFESPAHPWAFLGGELGVTPLVDELDESERSAVHTPSLHTVSCADILALVYELEPEKSAVCVAVFLARKDCALALLGGELGATLLEEFEESEKPALQTQIEIVLQNDRTDRMAVIWAPQDCGVDGSFAVALTEDNKVLVLDDPEYVHYNAVTIDLTSLQDKRFMLLKKISVSNSANQHKCPARSQGREIFSSSCNALLIVTDDIAVTKRILWLPIKRGARVSQKDKLGLTYFFVILLLGWIPGVNAADENALLQGFTCTWICIVIVTIALLYFANKIYSLPPSKPYLFSEKVRIWINGEMIVVELYDDEGIPVGSWRCALFTANGNAVDFTEWVTNLFNFVLHIFVQQEDGVEEISFNQMDDPEFIGMPMDVYLHNPDTGRLRYIGRSVPQNGAPSERDIIILMESFTYELVQQFLM